MTLLAWLLGKRAAALKAWERSLVESRAFALPFDEALAHLAIARQLAHSDPSRPGHLARARELFEQAGATHSLRQVQALERR